MHREEKREERNGLEGKREREHRWRRRNPGMSPLYSTLPICEYLRLRYSESIHDIGSESEGNCLGDLEGTTLQRHGLVRTSCQLFHLIEADVVVNVNDCSIVEIQEKIVQMTVSQADDSSADKEILSKEGSLS